MRDEGFKNIKNYSMKVLIKNKRECRIFYELCKAGK